MIATDIETVFPLLVVLLCWLISFRRTPYAVNWALWCMPMALVGEVIVNAALGVSHTSLGLIAAMTAGSVVPVGAAMINESCAVSLVVDEGTSYERQSNIWAHRHKSDPDRTKWHVLCETDSTTGSVTVLVVKGLGKNLHKREIKAGIDPITHLEDLQAARVQAEDAAATYNMLGL